MQRFCGEGMGATLHGLVEEEPAVFEAKVMLAWAFTEERAAEKDMPHQVFRAAARDVARLPPTQQKRELELFVSHVAQRGRKNLDNEPSSDAPRA